MTFKKNFEFDKEKKSHKVFKSTKDSKYRKKPYDYLFDKDDLGEDYLDEYVVDIEDKK